LIPVKAAPEPPNFDHRVRQPGLRAVAELVGEAPQRRAGRPFHQVADSRDMIPAASFPPYWRRALGDLQDAYDRVCAYLCVRISTDPTVDQYVAKSQRWDLVYEWSNYRLACAAMNSYKAECGDVLDPFELQDGWFALELVEFQVVPGAGLADGHADLVRATIRRLRLNLPRFCRIRAEFAEARWNGEITADYLSRHSPFVAIELRRQGRIDR
jgi:hypothetical protein